MKKKPSIVFLPLTAAVEFALKKYPAYLSSIRAGGLSFGNCFQIIE
jgi:hypothetical protein